MAYNCNFNSKGLSLKCAGPLQSVVTILHYNICEEENQQVIIGLYSCRPAPEKASGSKQITHTVVLK